MKDKYDTVIEKEPETPQDFVDILSLVLPRQEIMETRWNGDLFLLRWNQRHVGPLKGLTLREAMSDENPTYRDGAEYEEGSFFDGFLNRGEGTTPASSSMS